MKQNADLLNNNKEAKNQIDWMKRQIDELNKNNKEAKNQID